MRLAGKVAIVTGSSRGIGKAIALAFAREGGDIVVNGRDLCMVKRTAKEVETLGRHALAVAADVSSSEDVKRMVEAAMDKFGRIDLLVNNAGTNVIAPTEELLEEDWDRVLNLNLKGVFLCSQEVGKVMIERREGRIINISSIVGKTILPMRAPYCSSKAGVIALTKVLAVEWAKYNIRVNAIAPGYIRTEHVEGLYAQEPLNLQYRVTRTPMAREGKPEEVANAAVFLACDDSSFITGHTLFVDGGWLAYGG